MTLSRHWYAQSPIHAPTRLEANRASLFNHFEWWPLIRSRRRCNSLVYRLAYVLAGRPHPISELGHAERRRVHVESLADAARHGFPLFPRKISEEDPPCQ